MSSVTESDGEVCGLSADSLPPLEESYLAPGCRQAVVLLLEGVDGLEAYVQLPWAIELAKVCHHKLWLSHGGRQGFLQGEQEGKVSVFWLGASREDWTVCRLEHSRKRTSWAS